MTSPKGPKLVVRTFVGKGLFAGQYARFEQQAVFRKVLWERSGRRQAGSPGRRSWRSAEQLKEEAGTVPFTGADSALFVAGGQALLRRFLAGVEPGVGLFQVGDGQAQVTLGGGQRAVAQQVLHLSLIHI